MQIEHGRSDSFQFVLDKLVRLSKIELKRLSIFSLISITCLCGALVASFLAVVPYLSAMVIASDQALTFLASGASFLFITAILFFMSARRCGLRLYSVIEPAKATLSLDNNPTKGDNTETNPNLIVKNSTASEVCNDRLPRTAVKFYKIVGQAKDSAMGYVQQIIRPVAGLQSFVEKQPILALGLGMIGGGLVHSICFRKSKANSTLTQSEINILKSNLPKAKARENSLQSILLDLGMMGLSYAVQTIVKESINRNAQSNKPKHYDRSTTSTLENNYTSAQIIPFESRQRTTLQK